MRPCTKETMLNNSGVISFRVDGFLVAQDLPADLSDSGTVSAWISHPGHGPTLVRIQLNLSTSECIVGGMT